MLCDQKVRMILMLMLMLNTSVRTEGLLMVDDHFFVVSHFTEVPDIRHIMKAVTAPYNEV
jgi:hypothetical protein